MSVKTLRSNGSSARRRVGQLLAATGLAAAATITLGQTPASAQSCYLSAAAGSPAPNHEMSCTGGWTAWLGGGNIRFMGALNSFNYPIVMRVYTGLFGSGGVRSVCVNAHHTLWEDSSVSAAGTVIVVNGNRWAQGSVVRCAHPVV